MAIRLWPHVLKPAAPLTQPPVPIDGLGWLAGDWMLQLRNRSEWNPPATPASGASPSNAGAERTEPLWLDTQPWCHD